MVDAMAKRPDSEEPNHPVSNVPSLFEELTNVCNQGFQLANDTEKTMFEFFEEYPDRMRTFKDAMSFLQMFPGLENSYVINGFNWESLGKANLWMGVVLMGLSALTLPRHFLNCTLSFKTCPKS